MVKARTLPIHPRNRRINYADEASKLLPSSEPNIIKHLLPRHPHTGGGGTPLSNSRSNQRLSLGLDLFQVLGPVEALGIDLVDIFGS